MHWVSGNIGRARQHGIKIAALDGAAVLANLLGAGAKGEVVHAVDRVDLAVQAGDYHFQASLPICILLLLAGFVALYILCRLIGGLIFLPRRIARNRAAT
ncbi:MAG: hypothetical protein B7W97_00250 [Mycobacterium sp. 20-66-4]|nr:MAG: hypothetical protein B7W97_00250 [Mycobacterium sp. 20-66-4]